MSKGILHVVSNVAHYDDLTHSTGLRLSELTRAYTSIASANRRDICMLRRTRTFTETLPER
jgi:hypothetical protein